MATRGEIEDYFLENYDTFEFLDFFIILFMICVARAIIIL